MPKNPINIFEYCEYLAHTLKGETFIFKTRLAYPIFIYIKAV